MTDKKDGPSKGPERAPTETGGAKRPFATIDLKPSDVREVQPEMSPAGTGGQSTTAAKIVAAQKILHAGAVADTAAPKPATATVGKPGQAVPGQAVPAVGDKPSRETHRETEKAAERPPPPPNGVSRAPTAGASVGRFVSHLAAGLAGGVLAMLGAPHVAPMLGLDLQRPPASAVSGLSPDHAARLNMLEKQMRERMAAAEAAKPVVDTNPARIEDLARQLVQVGEQQAKLAGDTTAIREEMAKQASLANAGDRLVRLEEQLAAMATAAAADPQRAGRLPQLAQLTGQLADLRNAIDTRLAAHRRDLLAEIDTRTAASGEAAEAARAGTQRLDKDLAAAKSDASRLVQRVDQLKAATDKLEQGVKALQDEAGGLKTALDAARGDLTGQIKSTAKPADVAMALAPLAAKVQSLETSVQSVMRAEEDRKSNTERIVLSLELGNLKRAMERGQAYAPELAEVRKVAGARVNLAPLERFQSEGVPTLTELARTFRAVANAVIDADQQQPDASVVDRLLSGAKTVVRVKKTAHAADDKSAEAIVSRMEAGLKELRLADVMSEAAKLSPKAAVPAQDWLRRLDARRTIETTLAEIDTQLKSSLGAGPTGPAQPGPPAQKGTK